MLEDYAYSAFGLRQGARRIGHNKWRMIYDNEQFYMFTILSEIHRQIRSDVGFRGVPNAQQR